MISTRAGSKSLIREINQALVINAVRASGTLSRTAIAHHTGLGLPTVSAIAAELIAAGLLYERTTGSSTGGRRPILLALNATAGHVVGVKLTEDTVTAVLTDLEATIVATRKRTVRSHDPARIVAAITRVVDELRPAAPTPILGVAVGLAGVVDRRRGTVHRGTYSDWRDVPLGQLLEDSLDVPVLIDNDVNSLAATEQWFGAGRGVADFLVVSLGRGIGLGMVLDGRLYRGAGGGAGEFGHVKVAPEGPRCACGARGCLEAVVGDGAITARASSVAGRQLDIEQAVALARDGVPPVREVFATAARVLGMAVANLVNVLDPQLIVLGGEGTRARDILLEPFREALREHAFDGLYEDVTVVVEPWDDSGWARGAASLLLGELFQPTLRRNEESRPSLVARAAS